MRRSVVWSCPWFRIVEKHVRQPDNDGLDIFYSVAQSDYVNIFAITREKRSPVVRQFRPAIADFTWELPAGTRDAGETARAAATRELKEETGLGVVEMVSLGRTYVDTARLGNRFHSFAAIAEPSNRINREAGVEVRLVPIAGLRRMIINNELSLQTHVGLVFRAMTHPTAVRMLARHGLGDVPRQFLG